MRTKKTEVVSVRVSGELKRRVVREASHRGEAEAVVIRQALNEWIAKHGLKPGE